MSLMKYCVVCLLLTTMILPTTSGYAFRENPVIRTQSTASFLENGSLSGYVWDTAMNPIPGALVRIYFHDTYEENYSDSLGYYHVTNIPICYCMKNATCSKTGYQTEWVLLSIFENTTYEFILTSHNQTCYPVFDGILGTNGWFISCVNVTFVINGDIDEVYYALENQEWGLYLGQFPLCDEGAHSFYWHYFTNGNMSDIFQIPLLIDYSFPQLNVSTERLSMSTIEITANTTDEISGINRVEFYRDGIHGYTDTTAPYVVVMVAFGIHRVKVVSYDTAGNSAQNVFITPFCSHSLVHSFLANLRTELFMTHRHTSVSLR